MDEYIRRMDAEKLLIERMEETALNNTGYQCDAGDVYMDAADRVRRYWLPEIPAADVRPVVQGTWVGIDDFPHDDWECDHCGCVVENTNDPWNYYHFCPNCGADMREES